MVMRTEEVTSTQKEVKIEENSPPQEILSAEEIIERKILPIVDSYRLQLEEDPKTLAREDDVLLGEAAQEDIRKNTSNLESLGLFLKELIQNPEGFTSTYKDHREEPFEEIYKISLRSPSTSEKLSLDPSNPDTELYVWLELLKKGAPELAESREERLRSVGRSVTPSRAIELSRKQAPKEFILTLTADQAYWEEPIRRGRKLKRRMNYRSGITVCASSQEGVLSSGVFFLGATPHESALFEERITKEECTALKEHFIKIFRAKEVLTAVTSPNT